MIVERPWWVEKANPQFATLWDHEGKFWLGSYSQKWLTDFPFRLLLVEQCTTKEVFYCPLGATVQKTGSDWIYTWHRPTEDQVVLGASTLQIFLLNWNPRKNNKRRGKWYRSALPLFEVSAEHGRSRDALDACAVWMDAHMDEFTVGGRLYEDLVKQYAPADALDRARYESRIERELERRRRGHGTPD